MQTKRTHRILKACILSLGLSCTPSDKQAPDQSPDHTELCAEQQPPPGWCTWIGQLLARVPNPARILNPQSITGLLAASSALSWQPTEATPATATARHSHTRSLEIPIWINDTHKYTPLHTEQSLLRTKRTKRDSLPPGVDRPKQALDRRDVDRPQQDRVVDLEKTSKITDLIAKLHQLNPNRCDQGELLHEIQCGIKQVKPFINLAVCSELLPSITLLHAAVQTGHIDIVHRLIHAGVDVNAKTQSGQTALHWAVLEEDIHMVEALIHAKASLAIQDNNGHTALHIAVQKNAADIVIPLLQTAKIQMDCQAYTDYIEAKDIQSRTALQQAIADGHVQVATILLQYRAKGDKSLTQLMQNLQKQKPTSYPTRMEQALQTTPSQWTPCSRLDAVTCRAVSNHLNPIPSMSTTENTLRRNARSKQNQIPDGLYTAICEHADAKASQLLGNLYTSNKRDINARDPQGRTLLILATQRNLPKTFEKMISYNPDVNLQDNLGRTALHWAYCTNQKKYIDALKNHNADKNKKDNQGKLPRDLALSCRVPSSCQEQADTPIESKHYTYTNADFHQATITLDQSDEKMAKIAVVKDELNDPEFIDTETNGKTWLQRMFYNHYTKKLAHLDKEDINIPNGLSQTMLSEVISSSLSDVKKEALAYVLLEKGADVHITDDQGNTALHLAVRANHTAMVKILLDSKANIHLPNRQGDTPLTLAKARSTHAAIIKLLEAAERENS